MPEASNLKRSYHIEGEIPCDNQMRGMLDPLNPEYLRPLLRACFVQLQHAGVIRDDHYWQPFVIVSVDGVEHFSSTKVHCPHCTTRTHRNGEIAYHHAGLAAVLVKPAQAEVFPLDFEPILNQAGAQKNDRERAAAKRLCTALAAHYPELDLLLVEAALYANAPPLRQITGCGWQYVLHVKPEAQPSLFKQCAGRLARGDVNELCQTDAAGVAHHYVWTKHLCSCDSAPNVTGDFLRYEQTTPQGEVKRWSWITNLPLQRRTVEHVMRPGAVVGSSRTRPFAHNYGHGQQHLATLLALLLLLAFLVEQLQPRCCQLFRRLWRGLGTKAKRWESLRSWFRVLKFPSMEALLRHTATLYRLQLESIPK